MFASRHRRGRLRCSIRIGVVTAGEINAGQTGVGVLSKVSRLSSMKTWRQNSAFERLELAGG